MTPSELQAENERLKAERDYCQRYYHDVVVEAKRLKAERDAALRSVQVLMESSADNLRLAVTRERERDALTITSEEAGDIIRALTVERDEVRAQAARLAEALRKAGSCCRCGGKGEATFSGCHPVVVERPCKSCKGDGLRGETRDVLASTDALKWMREEIVKELERLVDESPTWVSLRRRIAELRREET